MYILRFPNVVRSNAVNVALEGDDDLAITLDREVAVGNSPPIERAIALV